MRRECAKEKSWPGKLTEEQKCNPEIISNRVRRRHRARKTREATDERYRGRKVAESQSFEGIDTEKERKLWRNTIHRVDLLGLADLPSDKPPEIYAEKGVAPTRGCAEVFFGLVT